MEPKYIFHKELEVDDENNFKIDLTENNTIENVTFKKDNKYPLTEMKINAVKKK